MNKIALYVGPPYARDRIFDPDSPLNRDNCLAPLRAFRDKVAAAGGECHTFDMYSGGADAVLFLDVPASPVAEILGGAYSGALKCLLLQEPELIIPRNWETSLHGQFDRILTWNDSLVDGKKYFKFNYGNSLPASVPRDLSAKSKLCTLISGHCRSTHPRELYSKREEAVLWFERTHPGDFDLYGRGWDEYLFSGPRIVRALNRLGWLKRALGPTFRSYRGPVSSKAEVLRRYRFAICYENSSGMPGYISEKIFDCFSAGCVPIYWGAPNVADYIPKSCFVDKRDYPSYEELYSRISSMSGEEYLSIVANIDSFLRSAQGRKFSAECFAETLFDAVTRKL